MDGRQMGLLVNRGRTPAFKTLAMGFAVVTLLGIAGGVAGLRINLTGSSPIGIYRVTSGQPRRGAFLLVCLPPRVAVFARARGYVPRGGQCPARLIPVGKLALAVAGDTIVVAATGLLLNGAQIPGSQPLARDSHGRPLPHVAFGRYILRPGEFWLYSAYSPVSFDSRYFGVVRAGDVRASMQPVWVLLAHGEMYGACWSSARRGFSGDHMPVRP